MENPWNTISLADYEAHMRLNTVAQLPALNTLMQQQFTQFPVRSAMLLGAAGGNGLEHIEPVKYEKVYCVDINRAYLDAAAERYGTKNGVLSYLCADLTAEYSKLPQAELIIADLLIEYIGYECFAKVLKQVRPQYVSCVIQVNTDDSFVSDSPYLHSFDGLNSIHSEIREDELSAYLAASGYGIISRVSYPLPNGKLLLKIDSKSSPQGGECNGLDT